MSIETLITFFTASILLGLAPGPDNIFVLTQSALHGKSAGIVVMLGLCTGLIVHSIAVALGVAVIFQTSAVAFSVLKFIGAATLSISPGKPSSIPLLKEFRVNLMEKLIAGSYIVVVSS